MHYPDQPHIIEAGADITALHSAHIDHRLDGRKIAHLVVELKPEKPFTNAGLRLHVSNGVNHRVLLPTGEDLSTTADEPASAAETTAPVEDTFLEPSVTHAARRQVRK